MIHGFDDTNKEKVPIITVNFAVRLQPDMRTIQTLNQSDLEELGIDTNQLWNYSVLSISKAINGTGQWDSGPDKYTDGGLYPHVRINSTTKELQLIDDGTGLSGETVYTYKIRLIKAE